MWFTIDPNTGEKRPILGWHASDPTCPVTSPNAVYIGRTHYSIMMVDSRNTNRKWNVTFYEYSAASMNSDALNNYRKHFYKYTKYNICYEPIV